MNNIDLPLSKDKYLDSVFPNGIPINIILNKTICGCGATHLELKTRRHSIIIEPNVPVIKGKLEKHKAFLLGVYDGVTDNDIIAYFKEREGKYKKIMTTPEGFKRVKRILTANGVNIYEHFFCLFDECDRIIKDTNFRGGITLPITDFFKFKSDFQTNKTGKAMVSATPIVPADPRFEEHNFQIIKIRPDYPYKTDITVIPTNNLYLSLKKKLDEIGKDKKVCIFFNSPLYIKSLIKELNIADDTNIYCSEDSADKLVKKGYNRVFSDVYDKKGNITLNRYNFFTSRFYSAVDIELKDKPIVIALTNVIGKSTTLIDPATDAVQIVGRFRNGVESYLHITNYDNGIKYWKEENIKIYLNQQHTAYAKLRKSFFESRNYGERQLLKEALQRVSYFHYVTPTGEKDYFRHMNAIMGEYIKSIYERPTTIKKAYDAVDTLNVQFTPLYWLITDLERRTLQSTSKSKEERNKCAYYLLHKLKKATDDYQTAILANIREENPLIKDAYKLFGIKGYSELNFKETELKKDVDFGKKVSRQMKYIVQSHFKINTWYSAKEINDFLKPLFEQNNIKIDSRGMSDEILLYFDADFKHKKTGDGWHLNSWQKY